MYKIIITALILVLKISLPFYSDTWTQQREFLVNNYIKGYVKDDAVINVMRTVPRHLFVPSSQRRNSYQDRPLPIGFGQTISQPSLVAKMTELINIDKDSNVLEIGTGSGYQAAILSYLAKSVYTIEIYKELAETSEELFSELKLDNISVLHADGYYGWKEHAPYDAIMVTCAAEYVPPPLIEQLKPNGIMLIPVGPPFRTQRLLLLRKGEDNKITTEVISYVRFVPFIRSN